MKKIYGYAALFAAMSLASCSSDNEPNVATGEMQTTYLAVNIANPDDTRADGNVREDLDENGASTASFILFDASGARVGGVYNVNLSGWNDSDESNVDRETTVLAVEASEESKPASIIMVLNADATVQGLLGQCTSPAAAYQKLDNYVGAENAYVQGGKFLMSNAVYNDGTKNVYAQPVEGTYTTKEDAVAHPTDIDVERIVARVDTKLEDFKNQGASVTVNGVERSLTIDIKGVEVANIAQQSTLLKSIEGLANPLSGWSWNGTHQSHWAAFTEISGYDNKSYDKITDVFGATPNYFYVQENTTANEKDYTSVLVTAQLMNGSEPAKLVRILNNKNYYFEDDAATTIMGYLTLTYGIKKDNKVTSIAITDDNKANFEWVSDKTNGYEGCLQIADAFTADGELVKRNGENWEATTLDDINTTLKEYKVWRWNDGMCYYYSAIKNPADNAPVGVVRNHIYEVLINSIMGLGVPVFDPNEVIIPQTPPNLTPDEEWYLGAKINILKWTKYTQPVNFGQGGNNYTN